MCGSLAESYDTLGCQISPSIALCRSDVRQQESVPKSLLVNAINKQINKIVTLFCGYDKGPQ